MTEPVEVPESFFGGGSLSLSSFLSSESRSNAVPELVEGPSIDYAESQKKYSRAQFGLCRGAAKDMKVPESFFISILKLQSPKISSSERRGKFT